MNEEISKIPESFPNLLKKIRKDLNLTQEQLAQRLGVSYVSVNEWENARRKPSPLAQWRVGQLVKEFRIKTA
jgi:type I restriction enzyme M protein